MPDTNEPTAAEKKIAELKNANVTDQDIATRLEVSVSTVKAKWASYRAKTGAGKKTAGRRPINGKPNKKDEGSK